MDEWLRIGEQLFIISDSSAWWMGDWLAYGQDRYPDRYKRAIEETSLDYQTLRNYAWVARRFDVSRRRDKLSVQHHVEVAALPQEEQERWLDLAEKNGWSRNRLRKSIKTEQAASPDPESHELTRVPDVEATATTAAALANMTNPPSCIVLQVEVAPDRKLRWEKAAEKSGRCLADWMSFQLDQAALSPGREPTDHSDNARPTLVGTGRSRAR